MKLFKLSQNTNNSYDTFYSIIVSAEDAVEARVMRPTYKGFSTDWSGAAEDPSSDWAYRIEEVNVEYIGEAKEGTKRGIILASFHAG